jgi:hypothetical protein
MRTCFKGQDVNGRPYGLLIVPLQPGYLLAKLSYFPA